MQEDANFDLRVRKLFGAPGLSFDLSSNDLTVPRENELYGSAWKRLKTDSEDSKDSKFGAEYEAENNMERPYFNLHQLAKCAEPDQNGDVQDSVLEDVVIAESLHVQSRQVLLASWQFINIVKDRVASQTDEPMASWTTPDTPTMLPNQKVLKLLLGTMIKKYANSIPHQRCGSPITFKTDTQTYSNVFYISKDHSSRGMRENLNNEFDIPVRYQGFTKGIIWFCSINPCWGLVARRMQHQSRLKQTNNRSSIASEASQLFLQMFEGYSYVLLHRSDPLTCINRLNVSDFVVSSASKLVQVWPIKGES